MRTISIIVGTVLWSLIIAAHEIEGVAFYKGTALPAMTRTQIPFDVSIKETTGRTYVLWIAPDGAIAFHIDPQLMTTNKAPLTKVWMIEASERLTLPKDIAKTGLKNRGPVDGVEEMKGPFKVDWGNDLDYTIYLDVKGTNGVHGFKGFLYGSPQNKQI